MKLDRSPVGDGSRPIYQAIQDPPAYLAEYEALMKAPTNRLRIRAVLETLPEDLPRHARVLDVGSGAGAYTREIVSRGLTPDLYALDVELTCIRAYRLAHQGAKGVIADATVVPLQPETFDLILAIDIIEHLPRDLDFLKEMRRLLKPGGSLVVCTHNSLSIENVVGWLVSLVRRKKWLGWDPTHLRFYNPWKLRRMFAAAGLEVRRVNGTYFLPFHLPARAVSKPLELAGMRGLAARVHAVVQSPFYALNYLFEKLSLAFPLRYLGWGLVMQVRRPSL